LGQIHVAALAGVHDLPLGHPGHRLLRRRLGGGVLLLGLLPATLAALRALGRHRLPDLLALGGRGGLAGGLWLFGGWFLRRLLLVGVGEDHLDAGDRIVLRQVFKDQRELLICQRLHVVFGSLGVFRQDLRDGLGGKAEIL
ncbi:Ferric uptake regulation protein, partial [Dysosmobacter welbionis]